MLIRGTSLFGLSSLTRDGDVSRCVDALIDKDGFHIETLVFQRNSPDVYKKYLVPTNLIFPLIPNAPIQMNLFTNDFQRYRFDMKTLLSPVKGKAGPNKLYLLGDKPEQYQDSSSPQMAEAHSLKSLLNIEALCLDGPIGKMLDVFISPTDFQIQFYKIRNESDRHAEDPSLTISPRWIDHIDWTRGKSHLNLTKNTVAEICLAYPTIPDAEDIFSRRVDDHSSSDRMGTAT